MAVSVLLATLSVLVLGAHADEFAVLVAGSYGFSNYRHQADIAHAYRILRNQGLPAANIITFFYNDIPYDSLNPYPGMLYNHPNLSVNYYEGLAIDYMGNEVTPENFKAVLTGDEDGVTRLIGDVPVRVLKSTPKDNVFIYFADHGNTGLIGFPTKVFTAKDFNDTLVQMIENELFGELLIYIEACYSGTLFAGILPTNKKILALTAANTSQSSYATYCGVVPALGCLGDEFSVSWMEDIEAHDDRKETVKQEYKTISGLVSQSQVRIFGDLRVSDETLSKFMGLKHGNTTSLSRDDAKTPEYPGTRVAVADVELYTLQHKEKKTVKELKRIHEIQTLREAIKKASERLAAALHRAHHTSASLHKEEVTGITDLECHHKIATAYRTTCPNMSRSDHSAPLLATMTHACNLKVPAADVIKALRSVCN